MQTTEPQYNGPMNPGSSVTCEACGRPYVPQGYELGPPQPCPTCGR